MAKIATRKRFTIRRSDGARIRRALEEEIGESSALFFSKDMEKLETTGDVTLYLIEKKPVLMEYGSWFFPTLRGAVAHPFPERNLMVDAGAVAFIAKGADLMRPGTTRISPDIKAEKPALIIEETHNKPLAVAVALMDAAEMEAISSGKIAKNVHYVGDALWNIEL